MTFLGNFNRSAFTYGSALVSVSITAEMRFVRSEDKAAVPKETGTVLRTHPRQTYSRISGLMSEKKVSSCFSCEDKGFYSHKPVPTVGTFADQNRCREREICG